MKQLIKRILKEETENIYPFLDQIAQKHPDSNKIYDFVVDFIEKSDCKRIEFTNFKVQAYGAALNDGVLINTKVLQLPLPLIVFIIFHEIAHQYQYKKYGLEKMSEFYFDKISLKDAAKFMKNVELVADEFADRKIREIQKKFGVFPGYVPIKMYKNIPESQLEVFIDSVRKDIEKSGATSLEEIATVLYNKIKSEL